MRLHDGKARDSPNIFSTTGSRGQSVPRMSILLPSGLSLLLVSANENHCCLSKKRPRLSFNEANRRFAKHRRTQRSSSGIQGPSSSAPCVAMQGRREVSSFPFPLVFFFFKGRGANEGGQGVEEGEEAPLGLHAASPSVGFPILQ